MKDEIKETINILYEFATNINSDYIYDAQGFDYPLISDCIEELLKYITNLQEDRDNLDDYNRHLHNENKNLKQINEEHRELNGNLRTANSTLCEVEDFMYNQAKEYKTRNEKAIDMLNLIIPELWNINNHVTYKIQDVRRILQGKSDE